MRNSSDHKYLKQLKSLKLLISSMTSYPDLKEFLTEQHTKLIIVADGQTRSHEIRDGKIIQKTPAGGVSVAFDALARAGNATYIARGRTEDDRKVLDANSKVRIESLDGDYTLKRIFLTEKETDDYYFGFSNQTLWPLCHVAFEKPEFNKEWYEGYKAVNKRFADAIKEELDGSKTLVWINDYQLSLVPTYLGKHENVSVGMFWHIPWPTWEVFRILPGKKDILWSLLSCDFMAFHRRYQASNFMTTVDRELEARIDRETNTIFFGGNTLRVESLPMGIDTDVISSLVTPKAKETYLVDILRDMFQVDSPEEDSETAKNEEVNKDPLDVYFDKYKVILGVDRLDYTKGLLQRLMALDAFFANYPEYREKVIYLGIMSPSRDKIPSYKRLRKDVETLVRTINKKYETKHWKPLNMLYQTFSRDDIINFYNKASICLVNPLDDGMNLVSKEFIIAASTSTNPGMLVLSQFAGSATDLNHSLIVNPYDTEEVARAIKRGIEMPSEEKIARVKHMVGQLEEHNIYEWAKRFTKSTITASLENNTRE